MPKDAKGWVMFALTVIIVIVAVKKIPQINAFVGL